MSAFLVSFHGGSTGTSINNILSVSPFGSPTAVLAPNSQGVMPALSELRGFITDSKSNLYILNAYKDFSQILLFSPPATAGEAWTYSGIFAGGKGSDVAHPFCAVFGVDGNLYVSNQDPGKLGKIAITYYEGPSGKTPGQSIGTFAEGFNKLRGIATDSTYWYVADEDGNKSGVVWIYDLKGNKQSNSLAVKDPVHLLYDGAQYLYIGSGSHDEVYQYDTTQQGSSLTLYIKHSSSAPIKGTSGLAISGTDFYVASRNGNSINQYAMTTNGNPITPPPPLSGTAYVTGLADNPEFIAFF